MRKYDELLQQLKLNPRTWFVTGVAGFIGSNLLEVLLKHDQQVVGMDNFSTGFKRNLNEVEEAVDPAQWKNFTFIEGNVCDLMACRYGCDGVDYVLHQAALGSVPRSIEDPIRVNQSNVDGFLNMLVAARDAGVRCFVYAASSSSYGDHPGLPKVEERIGKPLSPYAVTKLVNELYAGVFSRSFDFKSIGLRYFNIFGRRQDPEGDYAAVIPKWVAAMINGEPVYINGDGDTSRDFCFIDNAIQANLLAATAPDDVANGQVYNVAVGERTSLNELYSYLRSKLANNFPYLDSATPIYRDFRDGDVRHSLADISKARISLGYTPTHGVLDGLTEAMDWYVNFLTSTGDQ